MSACICVWTWPTDLKFSDDVLIFPTFPLVDSFLCKPFEENGARLPVRVVFGLPFEKNNLINTFPHFWKKKNR